MAQPTFENLFGTGATFNPTTNTLEIPLSALAGSGLDATSPTATKTLGAIVKNAHSWLEANQDEEIMVTASVDNFAPVERNELDKTQFSYTVNFYGDYQTPTFDPDEV